MWSSKFYRCYPYKVLCTVIFFLSFFLSFSFFFFCWRHESTKFTSSKRLRVFFTQNRKTASTGQSISTSKDRENVRKSHRMMPESCIAFRTLDIYRCCRCPTDIIVSCRIAYVPLVRFTSPLNKISYYSENVYSTKAISVCCEWRTVGESCESAHSWLKKKSLAAMKSKKTMSVCFDTHTNTLIIFFLNTVTQFIFTQLYT